MQVKLLKPLILIAVLSQAGCDQGPPPADAKPAVETIKIEPRRVAVVYPEGAVIPDGFIHASFINEANQPHAPYIPDCMIVEKPDAICDMAIIDLNRDDKPEIVVLSGNELIVYVEGNSAYDWFSMSVRTVDEKTITAFKAGQIFSYTAPFDDLGVGTKLIDISDGVAGEGYWKKAQTEKALKNTK